LVYYNELFLECVYQEVK